MEFFNYFSTIISVVALIISAFALYLSYIRIRLSTRPYVVVESFAAITSNNVALINNAVMLQAIQSPAKITHEEYSYEIYSNNKSIQTLDTLVLNTFILFPSSASQSTRYTSINILDITSKLISTQELRRIAKINYRGLTHKTKYYFVAVWKFNIKQQHWDPIEYIAN